MRSARRKVFIAKRKKEIKKNSLFLKLLIPICLVAAVFIILKMSTRSWNGTNKIPLVYREDAGNVVVTVLDPKLLEITTLIIPGNTEVAVARNYGTLQIKNVWQLGVNEKIGGNLLAETITQNFLFPTTLWSEGNPGIENRDLGKLINFIFGSKETNIPLGDRIQIVAFSLKIQDFGRSNIDLGKSQFLDKKKLSDGQIGYVLVGPMSQRLTIYFSDNEIGNMDVKVNITDATGKVGVSERLGEILQVIGGKVVSVDRKTTVEDIDCVITGLNGLTVKKISKLFSCRVGSNQTSFDLDIRVGSQFAKRF